MTTTTPSTEEAVRARYAAGAAAQAPELCCPVDYDPRYLAVIPAEVVERDYGCGDPSRHLRPGETVLDLGSGTGKICFIAAQVVGPTGQVIGVDMTPDMLEVARRAQPSVAAALGYDNVTFRRGRIQDLAVDLDALASWLQEHPVRDLDDLAALELETERLRRHQPLVASGSIDVVVSNCVLNLVCGADKPRLFAEVFRVLRDGGRAVISDIVASAPVPEHLQADPQLWSGCVSGALAEPEFLAAFERAGFHGVTVLSRQAEPWQVVEGIEFRSLTVVAYAGKDPLAATASATTVVYPGPWKAVIGDDGTRLERGEAAVLAGPAAHRYGREPYQELLRPGAPSAPAGTPGGCC